MSVSSKRNQNLISAVPAKLTLLSPPPAKTGSPQERSRRKSALDQRFGGSLRRGQSKSKPTLIRKNRKAKASAAENSKQGSALRFPNPKSPTFIQDSLNSIGSIRDFCRQCLQYVQQADTVLDQLQGTAKSLNEAGVLQKLTKGKAKNLSTNDLTTMLFALMNSPIGANFLGKLGGGGSDQKTEAEPSAETKS